MPLTAVREVLHHPRLSVVPLAPEGLAGMTLCRGEVLPVMELQSVLQAPVSSGVRSRVLVLQHAGKLAGISADTVSTATAEAPRAETAFSLGELHSPGTITAGGTLWTVLEVHGLFALFDRWFALPILPRDPHPTPTYA